MGLTDYFKPAKKSARSAGNDAEKNPGSLMVTLPPPVYLQASAASSRLTLEEDLRDNIKHQVILNFLAQKQQGHIWIQDNCGISEGVMVRKNRQEYICRPPAMANSPLSRAMALLNVQVRSTRPMNDQFAYQSTGCHDHQLPSH
jgi:hypothetical protein